jgi:hypothetical protein
LKRNELPFKLRIVDWKRLLSFFVSYTVGAA